MKIHEYQAKEILRKQNVPVPAGEMVTTLEEADTAAKSLFAKGNAVVVIKAQIHAGGRGKGGGVKLAKTLLTTPTKPPKPSSACSSSRTRPGPPDRRSSACSSKKGSAIDRELYLGLVLDRASAKIVFMASQSGGMEIEEVAHSHTRAHLQGIHRSRRRLSALPGAQARLQTRPQTRQINPAVSFMTGLYKAFIDTDSTAHGDQPLHHHQGRQAPRARLQDQLRRQRHVPPQGPQGAPRLAEEDPLEVEASKFALNYIKLDGSIACMVNGAGLAMATMDIIEYAGGKAANFLDVGGGANQEQIENAFAILLSDPNVKAIFINIFGGILRVDVLATARRRCRPQSSTSSSRSSSASKAPTSKKAAKSSPTPASTSRSAQR